MLRVWSTAVPPRTLVRSATASITPPKPRCRSLPPGGGWYDVAGLLTIWRTVPTRRVILNTHQVIRLYRRIAPVYDVAVTPFRWLGLRRHREQAIRALRLETGQMALDLGCGTGLNFPLLHEAVGPSGRIVGVDLSPDMLSRAQHRVQRHGLSSVELIEADLSTFSVPAIIDGAIATFALEIVPGYDQVIRRVAEALPRGGRIAVYGLKRPEKWPEWLIGLGAWINKPFGVSRDYESFRPYESERRNLREVQYREFLLGAAYLCVGEKIAPGEQPNKS